MKRKQRSENRLVMSVPEAGEKLDLGREASYRAAARGDIPTIRIGGALKVPVAQKGIGLGSVTATLLAGVLIGQLGITISQPLKAFVFLLFLFAVGYGVSDRSSYVVLQRTASRKPSSLWSNACSVWRFHSNCQNCGV